MPRPTGRTSYIDGRRLSVRLSVCHVPDHKSTTKGHRKLNIGRKEDRDTGDPWPHLEIKRSKVKITRPINAVTENQPCIQNRKDSDLVDGWSTMTDMRSDLQAERSGWPLKSSHHLQGAGAYCIGLITDHTHSLLALLRRLCFLFCLFVC